tara:strand:+ start:198 stop:497 length:300 start_codon:yes stop_codon:yes gene_type:complete
MKFLLSSEAAEARVARLGRQIQWRGRLVCVVHVEIHGALGEASRFEEFDAPFDRMANFIAKTWITRHGASTAAIRWVYPDGKLSEAKSILDFSDYLEAA